MNSSVFFFVTAGLYWAVTLCWFIILIFYWREYRRLTALSSMIGDMLVVVFLDGARTLLENIYFGTWFTARTGLIPGYLYDKLSEPQYVLMPKVINLLAALMIISVLVRKWFPDLAVEMERQRRTEQLYAELKQTHEDLQTAQEARDALTHMIVHDMRTPLTSIISGLQTLQLVKGDDPEIQEELTEGAISGAGRLLLMVNDLLDISKMESGEMSLKRETFPIGDAMDEAAGLVEALARSKTLTIHREDAHDATTFLVDADREIVRRVLVNLLGNAIKYSPADGVVTMRAAPDAGLLRVSVIDQGPGIAPEHQKRIFEKFYQVQPGSTGGVAATGLGLTFCKMAAEAHGGKIGVNSEPGRGSTFWFTLPQPKS